QKTPPPQARTQPAPPPGTGWMQQGAMPPRGFVYQPPNHPQQFAAPPGMSQNIPPGFQQMPPAQFASPQGYIPAGQSMRMPSEMMHPIMTGGQYGPQTVQPGMTVNPAKPSTPKSAASPAPG